MKKVMLTGDRPTGRLHVGHYVGSLRRRVELQNTGDFDDIFIMIADAQALTDNADNPEKVRQNIIEVALDYMACGLDPEKSTLFIQSQVPELTELSFYYMNLVTVSRLQRNPTVKNEIKMRNFEASIPVGFFTYPISQAADITAFKATVVPVGEDQLPMLEQTKEIVHKFNSVYGDTLIDPKILLPENEACLRLPGIDGKAKMSKSLGNCIYLSEESEDIKKKVFSMFTDPNHIRVEDPGSLEGNTVFTYLDAFCKPTVPVGEDQLPMIEQAREIVRKFNSVYGETLVEPTALIPENEVCCRLPGTDGKAKMSKSLGNCIYLSDTEEEVRQKIMSMYTDPNHIKVSDTGSVEGNAVFTYLDAFSRPEHFERYLPDYKNLDELKAHYQRGGLGDMKVKRFLNNVLSVREDPLK